MTKTQQHKRTKPIPNTTKNKGNIIICWCDNGLVDGKFAEGVVYSVLTSGLPIASAMRVQGNQIGRQRQNAFDYWYDHSDYPWILWVDSDIVLTNEALNLVWNEADPTTKPVVCGTYFVSKENEQSLMTPYPALFQFTEDPYKIAYVHPLPSNALVKVGAAGFGFVMMHRSAAAKMREVHGVKPFFNETGVGEQFVSEDINFFRLMNEAGVPLYAHTGAVVKHMKRFSFDLDFYKIFWNSNETNPRLTS